MLPFGVDDTSSDKKVILITGPPANGRDDYIQEALPRLNAEFKVGYYHVFKYIQEEARKNNIPNLTKDTVFEVSRAMLERFRYAAFSKIKDEIAKSDNELEIISTPAIFRVPPRRDYLSGKVEGITLEIIRKLNPDFIVVLIDDLLKVRERIKHDALWSRMNLSLKDLAEWRQSAIELVKKYAEDSEPLKDWIIFAREHSIKTFVDLLAMKKPRIYLSYHITGHSDFGDVQRFMRKLSDYFVCIDPYTIKDWDIVTKYDEAVDKGITDEIDIEIKYKDGLKRFKRVPIKEIEDAIDLIRSQIVQRDFQLIAICHATVVYHRSDKPSYGVMCEIIHSVMEVSRPVYVLYPFKTRPSPFFENFVDPDKIIYGDGDIEKLENELINKLKSEYKKWVTYG